MMTISRKKWGNGFRYVNSDGKFIANKSLLKRLKKLVIPPMWTDVQICKFDDGHIQATGRDLKGRKQYIYHSQWEKQRQQEKFLRLKTFGKLLPEVRKICHSKIKVPGWGKDKVLSLVLLILDETGIRIGNRQYTRRNETYGLTTLRRKHLTVENGEATFNFVGKRSKEREVTFDDDELVKLIRKNAAMPGYEIFKYKDGASLIDVDSSDVNAYIHELCGDEVSSKDFRTWVATRYAVELYPSALKLKEEAPRKKFTNILIRQVADELGNTPTICRDYYVHPTILNLVEQKKLPVITALKNHTYKLNAAEKVILDVI